MHSSETWLIKELISPPKCSKTCLQATIIAENFWGYSLGPPLINGMREGWEVPVKSRRGRTEGRKKRMAAREGRAVRGGDGTGGSERPETQGEKKGVICLWGG